MESKGWGAGAVLYNRDTTPIYFFLRPHPSILNHSVWRYPPFLARPPPPPPAPTHPPLSPLFTPQAYLNPRPNLHATSPRIKWHITPTPPHQQPPHSAANIKRHLPLVREPSSQDSASGPSGDELGLRGGSSGAGSRRRQVSASRVEEPSLDCSAAHLEIRLNYRVSLAESIFKCEPVSFVCVCLVITILSFHI